MGKKLIGWGSFHAPRRAASVGVVLLSVMLASQASAYDPLNGDFSRDDPADVRIAAYNHNRNFIESSSRDAAFNRVLVAINPDIICFEEFTDAISPSDVSNRLNSILPLNGGGSWQIHFGLLGGIRTVVASRYPLTMTRTDTFPGSSTRGVTIALVDLPDVLYDTDIYVLGAHLKCCGNPGGSEDASRQDSADAIANWMGDARGATRPVGDFVSLPANTPMIALGDFNLVGGPQPENTLITGNIQDESTYGSDVKGDWDNSNLTNLNPTDPFTGDNFTWQGSSSFDPSPLDRMFYTDSVITVANSFVLNTDTMTSAALSAAGLHAGDTLPNNTSDHLPIVMDLRLTVTPECAVDADCDDGVFCNGAEFCDALGACQDGGEPCPGQFCREADGLCVDCLTDGDCDNGVFCDGAETCLAAGTCEAGAAPCTGGLCDESSDACVACFVDSDCDDGNVCNGVERCDDGGVCLPGSCDTLAPMFNEDFNAGAGGFAYADDIFGTDNPNEAQGNWDAAGGLTGSGALRVYLGPGNTLGATSGGWQRAFTLADAATVTVTLQFRMLLGSGCEPEEYGDALLAIDQIRYGSDVNESLAHVVGNGSGGSDTNTGWTPVSVDIPLAAGTHTLMLGAYSNGVTAIDEWVELFIDDIAIVARVAQVCTCDDGVFCNGAETCEPVAGCQAGGEPCPEQLCDETADACVDCLVQADCDDGVFCNGTETCTTGLCTGGTPSCDAGSWCDEEPSLCVPLGDGDFNLDGHVDLLDFADFQRCFGSNDPVCAPGNLVGGSAVVDGADANAFVDVLTGP